MLDKNAYPSQWAAAHSGLAEAYKNEKRGEEVHPHRPAKKQVLALEVLCILSSCDMLCLSRALAFAQPV